MTSTFTEREYGGTGLTLAQLDDLPRHDREAVVAGTIVVLRERLEVLKQQVAESEGLLRDAMLERGASIADAGAWQVKLSPRRRYDYDEERLSALQAHVEPEQYELAVQHVTSVKVDKRHLNSLAKRGGEIAAIIAAATIDEISGYVMEISARR